MSRDATRADYQTGHARDLAVYVDVVDDGPPVLVSEDQQEDEIVAVFEGSAEELRHLLATAMRELGRSLPMER